MSDLVSIYQRKIFTIEEAREILPVIYRITKTFQSEVKTLSNRRRAFEKTNSTLVNQLDSEISALIEQWNGKVSRLGGKPKGLWLADFDNGKGYFCWKFPETDILHHHAYNEGFSGRVPIKEP